MGGADFGHEKHPHMLQTLVRVCGFSGKASLTQRLLPHMRWAEDKPATSYFV